MSILMYFLFLSLAVATYWFMKLASIELSELHELLSYLIEFVLIYYISDRLDFKEFNWHDPSIALSRGGRAIVLFCLLAIVGTFGYAIVRKVLS
ncbi:MAG: hypothetical protein KDD67_01580 [Ignavibacteriae bacterium]|nr:hypothetical protein [Ignavibacteriota bacterium]MCB9215491.1 hypothetical protein [Ignavibacteria bacterium]